MKNLNLKTVFEQAEADLQQASAELNHPAEDVVNYSGCVFARKALYGFTTCLCEYYAQKNGESIMEHLSLQELLEYAANYNPEIKDQDFECVHCKDRDLSMDYDEVFYCDDVDQITDCAALARKMKAHVLEIVDTTMLQPG